MSMSLSGAVFAAEPDLGKVVGNPTEVFTKDYPVEAEVSARALLDASAGIASAEA
jgi:hypothetical protein